MVTRTKIAVGGMTCGHCVKSVQSALTAVPGVQLVELDLEKGTATVVEEGTPPELLIAAIEAEGYTAHVSNDG